MALHAEVWAGREHQAPFDRIGLPVRLLWLLVAIGRRLLERSIDGCELLGKVGVP